MSVVERRLKIFVRTAERADGRQLPSAEGAAKAVSKADATASALAGAKPSAPAAARLTSGSGLADMLGLS